MKPFRPMSAVEQLAAHLREEIRSGGLDGNMPGVARLVGKTGGDAWVIRAGPRPVPAFAMFGRQNFHRCLDSLFRHTPPSALLLSEPALCAAGRAMGGKRGEGSGGPA